ncbi:MAG: hypothetical protein LUG98_09080 [Tannerellaceae bacterium]|nr:hypothetical protein [Tannerellaceae bacterium]
MESKNKKDPMEKTPSANKLLFTPEKHGDGWLHTLQQLDGEQRSFIFSALVFGERFIKLAGPDVTIHTHTTEDLDLLIRWWYEGGLEDSGIDEQQFIDVTGALLGHYLNRTYEGYWKAQVTDGETEYTIHTNRENGTYSFYPFHTIRHLIKNKSDSLADAIGFIDKE